MYTIINTYPNTSDDNAKDIKNAAAKVIYEELIRYMESSKSADEVLNTS